MGLWIYYAVFVVGAWALRRPLQWFGGVARTFGHVRRLRAQVATNPSNVTARRDLARVYLERSRPGAASLLLGEALQRFPDDAELLHLMGVARYRAGDPEGALDPLVRAVSIDARVGFGESYRIAGDALMRLGRHEAAVDAYEHYVEANTSSMRGWCKLAMAHRKLGEESEAKRALREAHRTWPQLPGFQRRRQFGWFLMAQLLRIII